ncbi:hypothetical protein ONZ43_g3170 [Nemania bipapillata]|uniref:Uncharacterized protein n=1 Tax=Nemania bipapillata TaxID=110536 RepID=A0ACC2IXR8_9PEZI|nr:hypothetical protein ONZ43_g3170 [Nemania bipapillata]
MSPKIPAASLSRVENVPQDVTQQQDDSDDDDLSITSTHIEDNDSEREWEVDDILADRPDPNDPDAMQYLIKWEGFKLEDCTWEPVKNLGEGLLAKWDENKSEIGAGIREIFDLATYDVACAERAERHIRRNAKRQRLGLPPTPPFPPGYIEDTPMASDEHDSPSSDDEVQEEFEVEDTSIPPLKSRATVTTPAPPSATTVPKPTSLTRKVARQNIFTGIPSQVTKTVTPATLQGLCEVAYSNLFLANKFWAYSQREWRYNDWLSGHGAKKQCL